MQLQQEPIVRVKLLNRTKNRTLVTCTLSNINKTAYFYAVCVVHVSIFSTGGKFHLVSNFTQLHTLTLVAISYALLGNTSWASQRMTADVQVVTSKAHYLQT